MVWMGNVRGKEKTRMVPGFWKSEITLTKMRKLLAELVAGDYQKVRYGNIRAEVLRRSTRVIKKAAEHAGLFCGVRSKLEDILGAISRQVV